MGKVHERDRGKVYTKLPRLNIFKINLTEKEGLAMIALDVER